MAPAYIVSGPDSRHLVHVSFQTKGGILSFQSSSIPVRIVGVSAVDRGRDNKTVISVTNYSEISARPSSEWHV